MEITTSTCNTTTALSIRAQTNKKAKSSYRISKLVEQLGSFGTAYQKATQEIRGTTSFFKKEAKGTDRRFALRNVEKYSRDEILIIEKYIS